MGHGRVWCVDLGFGGEDELCAWTDRNFHQTPNDFLSKILPRRVIVFFQLLNGSRMSP